MSEHLKLFKPKIVKETVYVATPKLFEARKTFNLTLRNLEKPIGLSRTRINQIEKGQFCSLNEVEKIESFFKTFKKKTAHQ